MVLAVHARRKKKVSDTPLIWVSDHRSLRTLARRALINLCDQMSKSTIKEVLTLRKTLIKWATEILNYFETRLTNARTEGFNNIAKLYQKRAFGYKNFQNYRLRLLNAG